jgi:hypothetical protein
VSTAPAMLTGSCSRTRSSPASVGFIQKAMVRQCTTVRTPSTGAPPTPIACISSGSSEVGHPSLDGDCSNKSNKSNHSNHSNQSSAVCSPVVWPSTPMSGPITPVASYRGEVTPRGPTPLWEYRNHELTPVRELSHGLTPPPKESPKFSPAIRRGLEAEASAAAPPPFPAPQPAPPPAASPTFPPVANVMAPPAEPPRLPFDLQQHNANFVASAETAGLQSVCTPPAHFPAPQQAPWLSSTLAQEPPPPPMVSPKLQQHVQSQQLAQLLHEQQHGHVQIVPGTGSSPVPKFQPPAMSAPTISQFSIPAPPMVSPKGRTVIPLPTPKRLSFFGA